MPIERGKYLFILIKESMLRAHTVILSQKGSGQLWRCIHWATIIRPQYGLESFGIQYRAEHGMSLWASVHSTAPLFSDWPSAPCGTVQRIHAGAGIDVPSSHSWTPAKVPSTPPLMSVSSYPLVKASGAGWGPIRVRKRIAGPDTHSPEPFQALVLYFSPCLSMGTSRWMGPFVCRQWGWICLSESKWAGGPPPSRRRHECEPNTTCPWWTSWMLSVPGERRLTCFSGRFSGGCSAFSCPAVSEGCPKKDLQRFLDDFIGELLASCWHSEAREHLIKGDNHK